MRFVVHTQEEPYSNVRLFYFCHKGVAGIVFSTQRVLPKPTQNYLWLNRDKNGHMDKGR